MKRWLVTIEVVVEAESRNKAWAVADEKVAKLVSDSEVVAAMTRAVSLEPIMETAKA